MSGESWASGVTVRTSTGGQLISFPAIIIAADKGSEEPPHSGNFRLGANLTVLSRVDPANADSYADTVDAHNELAGSAAQWLLNDSALAATLTGTISGYTNTLTVESIRMDSFERDINADAGTFEDSLVVEVYAHSAS